MGQWEVYEAIQSLGGSATFGQIRKYLQNKYHYCSDSSAHDALKKLNCNGLVRSAPVTRGKGRTWTYIIVDEFPRRNIIVIENGVSRSLMS